jgi:hypothetical protein
MGISARFATGAENMALPPVGKYEMMIFGECPKRFIVLSLDEKCMRD